MNLNLKHYVDYFSKNNQNISTLVFGDALPRAGEDITVLIPTFRNPVGLELALNSALLQKGNSLAYKILVLSADCEDNATDALMEEYRAYDNIVYYKNSLPQGTWNRGVMLAQTKWICMLHDDDILYDNALEMAERSITRFNGRNLGAVVNSYVYKQEDVEEETQLSKTKTALHGALIKAQKNRMWQPSLYGFYFINGNLYTATTCGALLLREAVIHCGGFDDIYSSNDMFLLLRLMECDRHYKVLRCGKAWGQYTFSAKNTLKKPYLRRILAEDFDLLREYIITKSWFVRALSGLYGNAPDRLFKRAQVAFYKQFDSQIVDDGAKLRLRDSLFIITQKISLVAYCVWIWLFGIKVDRL